MRPNHWILPLALFILGLAAGPAVAASKLVTVIGTPDVMIDVSAPASSQRIPIELRKGVKASRLRVDPLLARQGRNRSTDLINRFTATLDPTATPVVIQVGVMASGRPLAGEYRLVLGLRHGRRTQRLAITVTVPAVVLKADPALKVHNRIGVGWLRKIPLDGFKDHVPETPRLVLDAASSELTNIKLSAITQPADGSIDFQPAEGEPTNLAPGDPLKLKSAIKDVPPGTYTGKVEVRGDQLRTPVMLDYEVVVARSGWWIVVVVALGFLTGLIVRKGLVAAIGWLQAGRAAHDYASELGTAATAAADGSFRTQMISARNTLLNDIKGFETRTKINDAVVKATGSWTAAVAAYEKAYTRESGRLQTLTTGLPKRTGIDAIDATLEAAREHAEAAALRLGASDPTRAEEEIDEAEALLSTTVRERASAWSEDADGLLEAVLAAPVRDAASLATLVATARTALDAVDASGATTAQRLDAANAALSPLGHVVREARSDVHSIALRALELIESSTLGPEGRPDPAVLRHRLKKLDTVLRKERIGDEGALLEMTAALETFGSELREQARAWSPRPDGDALVAEGKILEALTPPSTAPAGGYGVLGEGDAQAATPAESVDRGDAPAGEARTTQTVPSPATGAAPAVPAAWAIVASNLNFVTLAGFHVLRICVLTLIFSGIGWLTFHEHFTGTTEEMLGIFLWAFTTDLTIEGITQLAGQHKKTPATAAAV